MMDCKHVVVKVINPLRSVAVGINLCTSGVHSFPLVLGMHARSFAVRTTSSVCVWGGCQSGVVFVYTHFLPLHQFSRHACGVLHFSVGEDRTLNA